VTEQISMHDGIAIVTSCHSAAPMVVWRHDSNDIMHAKSRMCTHRYTDKAITWSPPVHYLHFDGDRKHEPYA